MHTYSHIEFDPAKADANLRKHKVSFTKAEEALRDPYSITIEDSDAIGEQRFITLGADTIAGYYLSSILRAAHVPG
ncbi:BrnT family toxin [Oxalobacteraceae bacterium A2-2]